MPVQKTCVVCGKAFSVPPVRAETAKACSSACAKQVRAATIKEVMGAQVQMECLHCRKLFSVPRSHVRRRTYCSRECMNASEVNAERRGLARQGDKNPMWKGGDVTRHDGYIYRMTNGHPFAHNGYVLAHRLVMEDFLRERAPEHPFLILVGEQRYLRRDIEVHHINEVRDDNRPENLVACTLQAHKAIHAGRTPEDGSYWTIKPDFLKGN